MMDFKVVLTEIHQEDVVKVDVRMRGEVEKEVVVMDADGGIGNHDLVFIVGVGFYNYTDCVFVCHKFFILHYPAGEVKSFFYSH